jgi:LysR family transcriptional regulator, hypochlorite-specific transcription factor HypT
MGPGNRPLDMDWLEDFLVLAATGNFSRAAQARSIAQPAFSRHIRALEEWVGVDLVDRSVHPAELTAAGARFLPLLKSVLADLEAARIKARAAHDEGAASLRLAATHVLSVFFFPRWLMGMEAGLRLGPVQTMSDSSRACEDLMLQRRVQFVLCYGHPDVPGRLDDGRYPVLHLGDDTLVPVSAAAADGQALHRIGNAGVLPVLGYSEASAIGRILAWRTHGAPVPGMSVVFTAHNAILLKTLALDGRGLAWLPRSLVADELREGRLCDAGDASWQVPIQIRLYRQPAEMAPVAEALWRQAGGSLGSG